MEVVVVVVVVTVGPVGTVLVWTQGTVDQDAKNGDC